MPIVASVRKAAEVDIRPLAESDLSALTSELGRSHAHYFRRRMPLQHANQGIIPVALHKGRAVGAALVLWDEPAEERQLRKRLPGVPFLYHVHVKPDLRCSGVGTQLLAWVHEELRSRGHHTVALGVDVKNKNARRLYERLGYDLWNGDRWGKGESQYEVMVLDLNRNDRTEFLGTAAGRYEVEPPVMTPQVLNTVINEVLGPTSLTPPEDNEPQLPPARKQTGKKAVRSASSRVRHRDDRVVTTSHVEATAKARLYAVAVQAALGFLRLAPLPGARDRNASA